MSLTIGAYTYGSPIVKGPHNTITVGKYCSFGENVILDGGFDHNYKFVSTYPFNPNMAGCGHLPLNKPVTRDIVIGNDVWIGQEAIITEGVTIGDGAVIGVRSIITKRVLPYEIVVGHNRSIGWRFDLEIVKKMLEIAWWNWPDERVKANAHLLLGEDIERFIKEYV